MKFGFDPVKSDKCKAGRGFDFVYAAGIFAGPTVEAEDARFDYGEKRIKALGVMDDVLLCVIYVQRDDMRWIISARKASRKERRQWKQK